ncbi:MAG: protein kinase domain-containing protein [Bryobacteraceae bacterium]
MPGTASTQARFFRFGPFELDVRAAELRKHGIRIKLREQPVQILLMLLDHPGEEVLREEIRLRLWPNNTIVEFDHGINAGIQELRDALGESADKPRCVETVARRGYRFLGEVVRVGEPQAEPVAASVEALDVAAGALAGRVLSHYRILHKLGEGGMGVVYRAEDLKLGRQVALKFLPCGVGELPESTLRRFEREARAASALNHPNICTIHGLEDLGGQPAIIMELVEGETLAARLAKGPLPLDEAVALAVQIAGALAEAHRRGVVHRDLKPANIMLTGTKGRSGAKVLDFGLAKMEQPVAGRPLGPADAETVTERGAIVGTLHYMSPEQVEGKEADARSDIFSFGLVLYEMVTGKRAFEAPSRAGVIAAILEREPPSFEPAGLNRVVRACLAKDPDDRIQSARDLKRDIEWSVSGSGAAAAAPRTARKWIPWTAAAVFAVVAFLIWLRMGPAAPTPRLALTIAPPADAPLRPARSHVANPEISPDGSSVLYAAPS